MDGQLSEHHDLWKVMMEKWVCSVCVNLPPQRWVFAIAMTEYQPYNMQADYAEARIAPPSQQLIQEMVAHASSRDGRDYSAYI